MNKKKKWAIILGLLVLLPVTGEAQRLLTLDSCRAMALRNNRQPDRRYSLIVFPRAGAFVELKNGIGSPILGLGIGNVFRLNNRLSLYADVSYQATSSVIGYRTPDDSGNNGYLDVSVGMQVNFGKQGFQKVSDKVEPAKDAVVLNGFWNNWFIKYIFSRFFKIIQNKRI